MKKNVKSKIVAIFLTLTLSVGSAIPAGMFGLSQFGLDTNSSEVYGAENHWSEPYLNKLVSEGVMRGDKAGNLNPESGITRAEFIAMINRSFGYKQKGSVKFSDVPVTAWYADDISIATKQGYFSGAENNLAKPEDVLKREEGVTLLCRALKIEGKSEDNFNFVDSRDFSYWSKEYIHAATEKQYVNGYPDQTFRPTQEMKRGEMARILADASGEIVQVTGDTSAGYTSGNVTLNTSGTVLKETVVPGDLYITAGLDLGYTTLENVTVLGDLIISGAGESNSGDNSVVLKDCKIRNMILNSSNGKKLSIRAEGSTEIEKTYVKSNTYLEEGNIRSSAFKDIELNGAANTHLQMAGIFETVQVTGEKNQLSLIKGYINRLLVDETATGTTVTLEKGTEVEDVFLDAGTAIKGSGKINNIVIGVNGSNIAMLPDNIEIRPGVSATINGKPMTSADAELNALTPQIISGPLYSNQMPTAIDATVKVNKPGKLYWLVKKKGEAAPTLAKMKSPTKDDGVKYANTSVVQDKDIMIKISGLTAGTQYELYTVLVDLRDKNSVIGRSSFSTVDNIAPKFVQGSPTVTPYATSAAITYTATKDATMYWAITEATAPAPTATELVNAGSFMVGKVVRGEKTSAKEIENTVRSDKDGYTKAVLDESKSYNAYMVLKDYSNNLSTVTKVTFSSKDVTPPSFMPNYPTFNSTANTSLTMKFMTNEPSTLYYAAFVSGDPFPFPNSKKTDDYLTTKSSIQAVINGNIGKKSGKATTTDKEGTLQISGLEAKKMYDIYVVLEDKAKNTSTVYLYENNALMDRTIPTATLSFLPDYDGRPNITSKIMMTFDKIVFDTESGKRLSEVTPAALEKHILLYDREPVDPVGAPVNIDFTKVKVEDKNSQTVVTFNVTPNDLSFILNSGNKYQFEIRYLADASGNLISPTEVVRLPEFTTVPPQINLNKNPGSDVAFDLAIELERKESKVASVKAYDTIIKSNVDATIDIYSTTGNALTSPGAILEKQNAVVNKDGVYSMTALINDGINASNFESFENLPDKRIYGIVFTMINGNTNKKSWQCMTSFEVQGLIGSGVSLNKIAFDPKIFKPTDATLVKENVQVVTNPISDIYEKPFMDSVVPEFTPPTPTVGAIGDSVAQINLMVDSPAKVYWVLAEAGAITTTPPAQQIIQGQPISAGGQSGNHEIQSAGVNSQLGITKLKPDQKYVMFLTAKGTPPQASDVKRIEFKTMPVSTPVIDELTIVGPDKNSAKMKIKVDADATVYWMAYPAEMNQTPSAEDLRDGIVSQQYNPVDRGTITVEKGKAVDFVVNNLIEEKLYTVYATAENPFSANLAAVKTMTGVASRDMTPPVMYPPVTYILSGTGTGSYAGTLTVNFDEYIYIQDGDGKATPLTKAILEAQMIPGSGIWVANVGGTNTAGAPKSIEFGFTNANINKTFSIARTICDKDNNVMSKSLQFVLKKTADPDSPVAWEATGQNPTTSPSALNVAKAAPNTALKTAPNTAANTTTQKTPVSTDTTGPKLTLTNTNVTSVVKANPYAYYGAFSANFDENIYYINNNGEIRPVTLDVLKANLNDSAFTVTSASGANKDKAVKKFVVNFKKMQPNDIKQFGYDICDKDGNNVGKMVFTLKETATPKQPKWDISFTN